MEEHCLVEIYCARCGMPLPKGFESSPGFTQWMTEHVEQDEAYLLKHGHYPKCKYYDLARARERNAG